MTKSEKARDLRLRRLYGLNSKEYEKVLAHQGGTCAICQRPPKEGKRLHVDHCHVTGRTRGLLCWPDNAAIAKFRDSVERMTRALAYLKSHPVTEALGREVFGRTGRVTNKRKRKRKSRRGKR
jgi:hypothetical protein